MSWKCLRVAAGAATSDDIVETRALGRIEHRVEETERLPALCNQGVVHEGQDYSRNQYLSWMM